MWEMKKICENILRMIFRSILFLLVASNLVAQDLSKKMVLALSFEEGAGQIVKDRSGNGNDAKNLSLHCRVYNTGQVRLGFYGNDHDSDPNVVKKTLGTI